MVARNIIPARTPVATPDEGLVSDLLPPMLVLLAALSGGAIGILLLNRWEGNIWPYIVILLLIASIAVSDRLRRHGNLYLAWSTAASSTGNRTFTRSTNGGVTWMTPIEMPNRPVWGTLTVDADGTLYIGGVSSNRWPLFYLVRSSNARNSSQTPVFDLSQPVNLNGTLVYGAGPNPGGLLGQVWIDVDRSGGPYHGRLYFLCSVNPPGTDPLDVYLAFSTDRGATWSAPIRVNDDPPAANAWQWFGTLAVAPNGRVDVIWYDTRNDPNGLLSELRYTYSYDGGLTWAPS
ncbi:MAG: sialidase family protein, partial [Chloroflexus sp.]